MQVMELVGTKITEGAKAFLYKEYIWLTIWSCSFAIVLGSTVDLLEMNMQRAPTNFPYTATSYLTGSMTSILAGYIGMRIAVYTNTRVTFTCCGSVHKGFITAFRGGQVLGFCLVGLGVLNIMIIILLFKACWYNEYLKQALAAKMPVDQCEAGSAAGMTKAQDYLWSEFDKLQYTQWYNNWKQFYPFGAKNAGTATAPSYVACTSAEHSAAKSTCESDMATFFDPKYFQASTKYVNKVTYSADATAAQTTPTVVAAVPWTATTCATANADSNGVVKQFNSDASCTTW